MNANVDLYLQVNRLFCHMNVKDNDMSMLYLFKALFPCPKVARSVNAGVAGRRTCLDFKVYK